MEILIADGRVTKFHTGSWWQARWLPLAVGALLFFLSARPATCRSPAPAEVAEREAAVKVTMLFKLALFVQWPETVDPGQAFVIGVLGTDPFGPLLEAVVDGEEIGGRPIEIRRSERLDELLLSSQILFVGRPSQIDLEVVAAKSAERHILTVGDWSGFCERGGIVSLVLEGDRVRVDLNPQRARAAGLQINAKLARLARKVDTEEIPAPVASSQGTGTGEPRR